MGTQQQLLEVEVKPSWSKMHPMAASFAASSVSVATGVLLTNWVDVIKIRQQLLGNDSRNLLATGVTIVKDEGFGALYKGVTPAVARGVLYGG
jgi:hypothetical protein